MPLAAALSVVEAFEWQELGSAAWVPTRADGSGHVPAPWTADALGFHPLPGLSGTPTASGALPAVSSLLPPGCGWTPAPDGAVVDGARVLRGPWAAALPADVEGGIVDAAGWSYTDAAGLVTCAWSPERRIGFLGLGGSTLRCRRWVAPVVAMPAMLAVLRALLGAELLGLSEPADGATATPTVASPAVVSAAHAPTSRLARHPPLRIRLAAGRVPVPIGGERCVTPPTPLATTEVGAAAAAVPGLTISAAEAATPAGAAAAADDVGEVVHTLPLPPLSLANAQHLVLFTHGIGNQGRAALDSKLGVLRQTALQLRFGDLLARALAGDSSGSSKAPTGTSATAGGAAAVAASAPRLDHVDFAFATWSEDSYNPIVGRITRWLERLHVPTNALIRTTASTTLLQGAFYMGAFQADIEAALALGFNVEYALYVVTHPRFAGWAAGVTALSRVASTAPSFSAPTSRSGCGGGSSGAAADDAWAAALAAELRGEGTAADAFDSSLSAVSIMAHSLGGVIALDIVRRAPCHLWMTPRHLFTLGAPIGMYYSMRGYTRAQLLAMLPTLAFGDDGSGGSRWTGTRIHNIYDDHDPIAYRLTPLFFEEAPAAGAVASGAGAVPVPTTPAAATAAASAPIPERTLTLAIAARPMTAPTSLPRGAAAMYASGLDIVIPRAESVGGMASTLRGTAFEVVQDYVDAFQAHQGYWSAPEVLMYIAREVAMGADAGTVPPGVSA